MATHIVADVEGLRNPVGRDTAGESRQTVDILSSGAAVRVDVTGKSGLVFRVSNEEDPLDRVEACPSEACKGVDGGGSTLRVSLEDEAVTRVGAESRGDFVDNVRCAQSRVLRETSGVDGVVYGTARELGGDAGVYGPEPGGLSLGLTGSAGIDDGIPWASGRSRSFREEHGRGDDGGHTSEESDEGLEHFVGGFVWSDCCGWFRG